MTAWFGAQEAKWHGTDGVAHIRSEAPLELIQAESKSLRGVIAPETRSFAFTVRINSFQGFNSEIQHTHFLENYMEEKKFTSATFTGKFIEDIPFDTPGTYSVRAKGNLEVHGIMRERIIKGQLVIKENSANIHTVFLVPVSDHGINIPKIVNQKIAEEIEVTIDIDFSKTQTK